MNLDELIEAGRSDSTTLRDWYRDHPAPDTLLRHTLAHVGRRVLAGEDLLFAVFEFLDEFSIRTLEQRQNAIDEPATSENARADAFLGGLAEYLAGLHHLNLPSWANEPNRFLDHFWFLSETKGFRAILIAHSPSAFRRRGIFVHPDMLHRH
ncbi:MAG: hypothetical protein ABIS18_00425 [Actinomycetota bacterium]